jgi:mannose/fructose/N-acetylgalactosamine-specific phosphotransferase system component IIC
MKSSIGAIILQLLGGIVPFAIFYWGFGIAIWLSIVLAVLVVGIFMAAWEGYLRKKDSV